MASCLLNLDFIGVQTNHNRHTKKVEKVEILIDYLRKEIVGLIGTLDEATGVKETEKKSTCLILEIRKMIVSQSKIEE